MMRSRSCSRIVLKIRCVTRISDLPLAPRRSSGFLREKPAECNAESVVIALRNANSPLVSYLKP
jgi:hypothetical protein